VLFITDLKDFPTEYDHEVLEILNKSRAHQIAVFNKLDLRPEIDREALKALLPASVDEAHFISSVTGENLDALMQSIINFVPYHDPYYEADQLSDLPTRFFATEVIREGIFHIFEQEIPYSTAVVIEKYTELPDEVVVEAQIWLERQSQKLIVVGRKGDGLRKIREYAEAQLSAFLDQPVRVHLWVKIVPNWRKKNSSLRELGFG